MKTYLTMTVLLRKFIVLAFLICFNVAFAESTPYSILEQQFNFLYVNVNRTYTNNAQ